MDHGRGTHFILQMPSSVHSSAETSSELAIDATMLLELMSGHKGTTATVLGTPSAPLKSLFAETISFRFFSWVCFAWFLLLSLVWEALEEALDALGDSLEIFPVNAHQVFFNLKKRHAQYPTFTTFL